MREIVRGRRESGASRDRGTSTVVNTLIVTTRKKISAQNKRNSHTDSEAFRGTNIEVNARIKTYNCFQMCGSVFFSIGMYKSVVDKYLISVSYLHALAIIMEAFF